MKTDFKSKTELVRYYADEEKCKALLAQQRWGNSPACPHCGNAAKIYVTNRGYKCGEKTCYKKFTVTTGTIFENTKIKLNLWFEAIFVITAHKKGISSHQLAKDIGCTQKTAWFILHRVREMLKEKSPELLSGTVEIDETYNGAPYENKHKSKRVKSGQGRSLVAKKPIIGLLQRGGKVWAQPVDKTDRATLLPIMVERVAPGSTVCTDEYSSYRPLGKLFEHGVVKHKHGEYVRGDFHTNGIENYWSLLKRGIVGVYHQVTPKHLHRYCFEFSYRYNSRKTKDVERFNHVLSHSEGRLTWNSLTAE
jgi:transposase-like protein